MIQTKKRNQGIAIVLLCAFSFCVLGCARTSQGRIDPVKSAQDITAWEQKNLW